MELESLWGWDVWIGVLRKRRGGGMAKLCMEGVTTRWSQLGPLSRHEYIVGPIAARRSAKLGQCIFCMEARAPFT